MLEIVVTVLKSCRVQGWLVGGSVRDQELGRYSPDLDIAVAGNAAQVAREIARALDTPWFALSDRHGAYRVLGREGRVDVTALRGGDLLADLAARDFTVNAMARTLPEGRLIDPYGGLEHLRRKLLVPVSDRIFLDDPLRLLRAVRFCHVLGFRLTPELVELAQRQAHLLPRAAPERVVAEVVLTLAEGRTAQAVRLWRDLRLLEFFLPLSAPRLRDDPEIAWLDRLDDLLLRPATWFPAEADLLTKRLDLPLDGGMPRRVALRLAALVLDVGPAGAEATGRSLRLAGDMIGLMRTAATVVGGRGRPPRGPPPPPPPGWPRPLRSAPGWPRPLRSAPRMGLQRKTQGRGAFSMGGSPLGA